MSTCWACGEPVDGDVCERTHILTRAPWMTIEQRENVLWRLGIVRGEIDDKNGLRYRRKK